MYEPPERPKRKRDAHDDGPTFGVVYANEAAHRVFASAGSTDSFPVGSIIVREKFAQKTDAQPQLLAVMIKRARGFNPKAGDWEFLTVDGALSKVQERQKTGSCLNCHAAQRARDFIFPLPAPK